MDSGENETLETLLQNLRALVKPNTKNKTQLLSRLQNLKERNAGTTARQNAAAELVEIITSVQSGKSAAQTALIVGCTNWLTQLYAPHKPQPLLLEAAQLERLLQWLQKSLTRCAKDAAACSALAATAALLKAHPAQAGVYWERLFHPQKVTLLRCLGADCGCARNDEFTVAAVLCLDAVLGSVLETNATPTSSAPPISDAQSEVCAAAADVLLSLHYADRPPCADPGALSAFLLASLSLLHKVSACCAAYAQAHVSELLGLARAYMTTGVAVAEAPFPAPQRVAAAQQSLYDSAEEVEPPEAAQSRRGTGGKVSKTRKPRAVGKGATRQLEQATQVAPQRFALEVNAFALMKISDSDASESEGVATGNQRLAMERQRRAKLRLVALMLIGVVTRAQQRRLLYGYWHALFASTPDSESADDLHHVDLLHCAQHDPNARCRSAALQVAAQLLLGSKGFLSQAECVDVGVERRPSAFMPFAQSLGQMVLAMYETLTAILAAEASLPVLTQALKCLAVLVQATPFPRLQSAAALPVRRFVQQVRRLVHHRDCTIQVSALMVMEFIVTAPELTPEIAEAVGIPRTMTAKSLVNGNRLVDEAAAELIPAAGEEEEYIESDEEESGSEAQTTVDDTAAPKKEIAAPSLTTSTSSWLLLRVLHNLDGQQQQQRPPTSVRIESLQVLGAMAAHFSLLRSHLPRVALALQQALQDALPDVRLYAARTLDSCAYQIGRQLLEATSSSVSDENELVACDAFWATMLPVAMAHIGGSRPEELPALKVCLCDALSNIGVVQFERLAHATQMHLFNFLSSISSEPDEEMSIRAAAVRALAVFVLFPSLRGNLVFVENAAELTLRLAGDPNLLVRVKAFWSMGNISDALIGSCCADGECERFTADLLRRLIEAATGACSDNDKVRSNAVRTLGNLLRLLSAVHFADAAYRELFQRAVGKLIDCVLRAGNAKVKWNSCYAIGQLLRSTALYDATARYPTDMSAWQTTLYPALCHVIVAHANFKVRVNATVAISHIAARSHYGAHFEAFFAALLAAIEQSYQLDNFYEYNHRDNLQEQLCLTVCHVVGCAAGEDFPTLRKHLAARLEVVRSTWARVTNRMVPERAAPLLACAVLLQARLRDEQVASAWSTEQRAAAAFIAQALAIE